RATAQRRSDSGKDREMNINDLTIGQAKELAAMFGATGKRERVEHGLQIVVADRGFVYIGFVTTDGEWVRIKAAKNIRRWGTTKGLGELVHGPTSNTELDEVGDIRMPFHALQHLIAVEDGSWNKYF